MTIEFTNQRKRKRDHDLLLKHTDVQNMSYNSEDYQMDHSGGFVITQCLTPKYCYSCNDTATWLFDNMNAEWPLCTCCAYKQLHE